MRRDCFKEQSFCFFIAEAEEREAKKQHSIERMLSYFGRQPIDKRNRKRKKEKYEICRYAL